MISIIILLLLLLFGPGQAGRCRKIDFSLPRRETQFWGKGWAGPASAAKLVFAPQARKSILMKRLDRSATPLALIIKTGQINNATYFSLH